MLERLDTEGPNIAIGTHIYFHSLGKRDGRKTNTYNVYTKGDPVLLGTVKWFGRWRKYAFEPEAGTVYEEVCLREIAEFAEGETKAHRKAAKA